MTDPTATANGNDTATTAEGEPAPPDAAALAKEVAEYKDKLLRALADMENLRRRTDREVADARAYAVSGLACDVNVPAGSVAQVIQPGYVIGERVLRPAIVGVSKEGPKPVPSESPTDETQTS